MADDAAYDSERLPDWTVQLGFFLHAGVTAFVVLALTAYTYMLDDIKQFAMLAGGGVLLAYWAALWTAGKVPAPPRLVWIPYAAFLVLNVASTVAAKPVAHWVGWQYVAWYTSTLGFVLLGATTIQSRRMAEWALRFWVLIALATSAFGLFHYFGFFSHLVNFLYAEPPRGEDRLYDLMVTFRNSRSMLSTILNTQFFGNFILMLMPVAAASAIFSWRHLSLELSEEDSIAGPLLWVAASAASTVASLACVYMTYAKSSVMLIPATFFGYFGGVYFFAGMRRLPYVPLIATLAIAMAATLLYFTWGDLQRQVTSMEGSVSSREVIFGGAWNMFLDNPVLGGGPGSFRIFFPEYRSPDFHMARINNVTVYAHNWVLDFLAENGAIGTAAYLAFLAGIYWLGWRAIRTCPDTAIRAAVIGCGVGAASLLVGSLAQPMSRWPVGNVSLHAMLGTMLGIALFGMTEPDGAKKRRKPEYAPAFAWDRPAMLRGAVAAAAAVFAIGVTSWSWNCFAAAVLHNEGLKKADEHAVLSRIESRKDQALDAAREAKDLYARSLELDPTRGTTYYKLAHIQNTLGEQEEALKTYRKLQEYQPDYSEIHYNLGVMQFSIANAKRKQADAERKAGKGDAAAALLAEADTLYKGSLASMERATRLSSKIIIAYMQARIMAQYAETMPADSPERAAMHAKAGATYERASQLPVSTVIVEDGQEDREEELRFSALLLAREAYVAACDKAGAIRMTEKYLAEVPTSLKSLQQAIDLYSEIGEEPRAIALLDGWLARNPLNPDVLNMKLKVQRAMGDAKAAAETAKYLLVLDDELKQRGMQFLPDRDVQRIRKALSDLEAQGPAKP